jgi:hypothetical protein
MFKLYEIARLLGAKSSGGIAAEILGCFPRKESLSRIGDQLTTDQLQRQGFFTLEHFQYF